MLTNIMNSGTLEQSTKNIKAFNNIYSAENYFLIVILAESIELQRNFKVRLFRFLALNLTLGSFLFEYRTPQHLNYCQLIFEKLQNVQIVNNAGCSYYARIHNNTFFISTYVLKII